MRKWIYAITLTGIFCLLISCTPAPSVSVGNVDYQALGIDTAQYDEAAAGRINRRNQEFFSIPGMVLFTNEGNATANWRLYYYNKATDTADIFCFDPLCTHNSCVARLFSDPSQLAYCAFDEQLYGTPTSAGVRDGRPFGNDNLYRIDLDTMEITCVFEGDGNELYDISAYDEYILFRRVGEGGKRELFRYDVTKDACEAISLGEEQKIGKLWVCGQDIFVSFANELELYRTDEDFSSFQNTGVLGHAFVSEKGVYWSEPDRDGNQSTAVYEGNLHTGATREIGTYPYRFEFQGFDDTYLYVCIYGCEVPRTDARSSVLHRIDIRTGALERMLDCSEDGYILGVHMDGGRLFLHQRRVQTDANADHTFWYLTQNTKGEWEKHSIFGKQGE